MSERRFSKFLIPAFLILVIIASLSGIVFADDESQVNGANVVASGTCGKNLTWELTGEGDNLTLTFSGEGDMYDRSQWRDRFDNYKHRIRTIIISPGVTSIGDHAFWGCNSLTSITIPNNVTSIGESAFSNCSSLTSITIPNSVMTIGGGAFSSCRSLTSITIPTSVTSIGDDAFYQCVSLTSITIPNSVTLIGDNAFSGCGLTSITIPNSVTTIGESAFWGCNSLTSITIPNNVTSIGESAFSNCSSLTSITIPNSVMTIGGGAFSSCRSLTSITIPNSVTSIGERTFFGCSSLTSVTIPNSVTLIGDNAFSGCGLKSITIPNSVTTIGESAFWGCNSLTSITIPNSVMTIEGGAFSSCRSLTSITIPTSVTTIGGGAFSHCESLSSITIPASVTSIGENAFSYCRSLEDITIPSSVEWIGPYAFSDCWSLSVNISNTTDISKDTFNGSDIFILEVNYDGTKEQWESLELNFSGNHLLVHCKDGIIWKSNNSHYYSVDIVKKPTCTKEGYETYTCKKCDHSFGNSIPKVEHTYDEGRITKQARDGKTGLKVYTCTVCGKQKNEVIPVCSKCEGAGKVQVKVQKYKYETCSNCQGGGRKSSFSRISKKCTDCGGYGQTTIRTKEKCSVCQGLGTIFSYNNPVPGQATVSMCLGCEGTGYKSETRQCSRCRGYGTIEVQERSISTCKTCGGKGKIKKPDGYTYEYKLCDSCWGNDYYVKFDANGGKNAPTAGTIHTLGTLVISKQTPTMSNKVFAGWSEKKNGTAQYQPGDTIRDIGKDRTLYAVWESKGSKTDTVDTKTKTSIAKATVTGISNKTYTGSAITQSALTVKYNGRTLRRGTDYSVAYKNNKNVGTATVEVTGMGNYGGKVSKTFKITAKLPSGVTRVFGTSRYATATKIADTIKSLNGNKKFNSVIVATGNNYPDALGGAYLAKSKNAPIVITSKAEEANTVKYISNNVTKSGTVYILGGAGAVSLGFEQKVRSGGRRVVRLGGKTRYETNIKILKEAGSLGSELIVVTGKNFPDALSASAAGKPILLVGDSLTGDQGKFVKNNNFSKITIIGGKGVVSDRVKTSLSKYGKVSRVFGANRYETSSKVAQKYFSTSNNMVMAIGNNYPDALTGGPLAMKLKAPLILTSSNSRDYAYAKSYRKTAGVKKGYILGGPSLIDNQAATSIMK